MYIPKKVKLTQRGWDKYNGTMLGIQFVDGVTIREVTEHEANQIGSSLRAEFEDGSGQVGAAAQLLKIQSTRMEKKESLRQQAEREKREQDETREAERIALVEEARKFIRAGFMTREELEKVADNKGPNTGIKGLREIADPLGVKANSIPALIAGILRRQNELLKIVQEADNAAELAELEKLAAKQAEQKAESLDEASGKD